MRRGSVVEVGTTEQVFGNPSIPTRRRSSRPCLSCTRSGRTLETGARRARMPRRTSGQPTTTALVEVELGHLVWSSKRTARHDEPAKRRGAAVEARRPPFPWEERPTRHSGVVWRSSRIRSSRATHPPRQQHLQPAVVPSTASSPACSAATTRARHADPRGLQRRRRRVGDRPRADRVRPRRRARARDPGANSVRLRPARHLDRGPLLRHLVQRLPRPDDRRRRGRTTSSPSTRSKTHSCPFNRNGVLFPRKIGGKYFMLSRPSDNGHTPFGDIFSPRAPT